MQPIIINIAVAVIAILFTSLLTYFITTLTQRTHLERTIECGLVKGFKTHLAIEHKTNIADEIEKQGQKLKEYLMDHINNEMALQNQKIIQQNEKLDSSIHAVKDMNTSLINFQMALHWMIVSLKGNPKDFNL